METTPQKCGTKAVAVSVVHVLKQLWQPGAAPRLFSYKGIFKRNQICNNLSRPQNKPVPSTVPPRGSPLGSPLSPDPKASFRAYVTVICRVRVLLYPLSNLQGIFQEQPVLNTHPFWGAGGLGVVHLNAIIYFWQMGFGLRKEAQIDTGAETPLWEFGHVSLGSFC